MRTDWQRMNEVLFNIASDIEQAADRLEHWAEILNGRPDVGSTEDWHRAAENLQDIRNQIIGFQGCQEADQ